MIRYFIPGDGDDAEHPNVFHLPSSTVVNGSVRLGDVQRHFPLPGAFHFRFMKKFRDGHVWVDTSDANAPVPSCDGAFTAKVSRLPADGASFTPDFQQATSQPPAAFAASGFSGGGASFGNSGAASTGLDANDLLNMGHGHGGGGGSGGGGGPGGGGGGGSSGADDLLGMFDHGAGAAGAAPALQPVKLTVSPPSSQPGPQGIMTMNNSSVGGMAGGSAAPPPAAAAPPPQQQQQQRGGMGGMAQQTQGFAQFPPQGQRRGL